MAEASAKLNLHRDGVHFACASAELPAIALSPAANVAAIEPGARAVARGGDLLTADEAHHHVRSSALLGGSDRELMALVCAPTRDRSIVEERARVTGAGDDLNRAIEAGDEDGRCRVVGRAVAELTDVVLSPAAYGAVREERAGVIAAGGELFDEDAVEDWLFGAARARPRQTTVSRVVDRAS